MSGTVITILAFMAVYLVLMIGIGIYGRRYARNFKDSITAAKRSTTLIVAGAALGAHIGSGFVVGGAEGGAIFGLNGAWYGIGCGLSWIIAGLAVVRLFYRRGYLSLSDYFNDRYRDKATRLIYSISTSVSYIAGMGAQILAGKAIFNAFGINGNVSIVVTALVVFFYASLSGLWGAYVTSVLQVLIIIAGMLAGIGVLVGQGVFTEMSANLSGTEYAPFTAELLIAYTLPTILSALVDQTVFQRTASAKSEKAAVRGHLIGGAVLIGFAFVPALFGMAGKAAFGAETEASSVFIRLITERFPAILTAIMVASIVAAIMSTSDGGFMGISTNLIYDIYKNMVNPKASEKVCRRMQLALNAAVCVVAILVAVRFNNILSILSWSYTIIISGCLVPFIGGLLWKRGTAKGALASAAAGILCAMLINLGVFTVPFASLFPLIPALAVYIAGSLMTKPLAR